MRRIRITVVGCTLAALGITQSAQAQWDGLSVDLGTSAHQLLQPHQDTYGDTLYLYGSSLDLGVNDDAALGGGFLIGGGLGVQTSSFGWKKTVLSNGTDTKGHKYTETQISSISTRPAMTATARLGYALNDSLMFMAEGGFAATFFRTGIATTISTTEIVPPAGPGLPATTKTTITKERSSQYPLALGAIWEAKAVYAPFGSDGLRLVLGAGDARYAVSGAAASFVFPTRSRADDLRVFGGVEMQL